MCRVLLLLSRAVFCLEYLIGHSLAWFLLSTFKPAYLGRYFGTTSRSFWTLTAETFFAQIRTTRPAIPREGTLFTFYWIQPRVPLFIEAVLGRINILFATTPLFMERITILRLSLLTFVGPITRLCSLVERATFPGFYEPSFAFFNLTFEILYHLLEVFVTFIWGWALRHFLLVLQISYQLQLKKSFYDYFYKHL